MSTPFKDLRIGLDEVEAFLAGKKAGYKVSEPDEVDVNPTSRTKPANQPDAFELSKAAKIEIEEKKARANRLRLFHCTHQPRRTAIADTPRAASV
jgi:hypothetical protein